MLVEVQGKYLHVIGQNWGIPPGTNCGGFEVRLYLSQGARWALLRTLDCNTKELLS